VFFVISFVLLLLVGRMLSRAESIPPDPSGPPELPDPLPEGAASAPSDGGLTGAEIQFPVPLPPVVQLDDGRFNRPQVLNYYFERIELPQGPADPNSFCDELSVVLQDPGADITFTNRYFVATPTGLEQKLKSDRVSSLLPETEVVIVQRWDLGVILKAIMDKIIDSYAVPGSGESELAAQ